MTATKTNEIDTSCDAYNTGYQAGRQGDSLRANPYRSGTWDHAQWAAGWLARAPHGWLLRYSDASYIRPATARELRDSVCAGAEGVIEVVIDGERIACYVEE